MRSNYWKNNKSVWKVAGYKNQDTKMNCIFIDLEHLEYVNICSGIKEDWVHRNKQSRKGENSGAFLKDQY